MGSSRLHLKTFHFCLNSTCQSGLFVFFISLNCFPHPQTLTLTFCRWNTSNFPPELVETKNRAKREYRAGICQLARNTTENSLTFNSQQSIKCILLVGLKCKPPEEWLLSESETLKTDQIIRFPTFWWSLKYSSLTSC